MDYEAIWNEANEAAKAAVRANAHPAGSDALTSMRSYPRSRSTFSVREKADGWWVREDFQIVRRGEKDDLDDWHGPFTEDEARANAAAWNEEARR